MGEYYDWVNADKKECICPNDFDFGYKRTESLSPSEDRKFKVQDRKSVV